MRKKEIQRLLENWREEKEAAYIFSCVAQIEKDQSKKEIFNKMASIEEEHASVWAATLEKHGGCPVFMPRTKTRCVLIFVRLFGRPALIDVLDRMKRTKIRNYFNQLEEFSSETLQENVKKLYAIERSHTAVLDYVHERPLSAFGGSAWHKTGVGIREIIFGMNDGLLSTFSLIAGLAGGLTDNAFVLFAGVAGAIAGSISMAAGAFVSARAEREVMELQLAIEKKELELMPEVEKQELTQMYKQKGLSQGQADSVAETIIANKDVALETMAREELGFSPADMVNPVRAASLTGVSFVIGAAVPIVPFIFLGNGYAFGVAIMLSLGGFYVIGAVRTIVTGKNAVRSGFEMFLIGSCAALITYGFGKWIGSIM